MLTNTNTPENHPGSRFNPVSNRIILDLIGFYRQNHISDNNCCFALLHKNEIDDF